MYNLIDADLEWCFFDGGGGADPIIERIGPHAIIHELPKVSCLVVDPRSVANPP
jgi:hypothetical protein